MRKNTRKRHLSKEKIATLVIAALFVLVMTSLYLQQPEHSSAVKTGIPLSSDYDITELYVKAEQCSGNTKCVYEELSRVTKENGPEASLSVLRMLIDRNAFSGDDHQAAHEIGRKTAKYFGISADSFLLCTTAFNYGCQHGFFEHVLGRSRSPYDAINQICGSLEKNSSYASKFKFYCYHGVGHGVMMANAYDLPAALAVCDSLETKTATDGCWQGVFMENVNGAMKNDARLGVFSGEEPLKPCSAVEDKYRHECFLNHAGWLMHFFGNDMEKASSACLSAPQVHISTCFHSLGLMVSNPVWSDSILRNSSPMTQEETAWELCKKFPTNYTEHCVTGAVANIMNFDELDVTRAKKFCNLVGTKYNGLCATWVGYALRAQTLDKKIIADRCAEFGDASSDCMKNAGLVI